MASFHILCVHKDLYDLINGATNLISDNKNMFVFCVWLS